MVFTHLYLSPGSHYAFMTPTVELLWPARPSLHAQTDWVAPSFQSTLNAASSC